MTQRIVTPKFLTKDLAASAYEVAREALYVGLPTVAPKRRQLHVVVLVPGMEDGAEFGFPDWPNYQLQPVCLFEASFGNPSEFEYPFIEIAQCKALQLWQGRNEDGHTGVFPHLLFPGDAPFWGGVKREGIVVTCSGIQPHLDKLMAGMMADMLIASAYEAWLKSQDTKDDVCFLT
ncbi:MAG: hypothetical protein KBD16_04135 [Candidatus Pacebacteria bacterium]|nr:hypothetical protein [Candidatus Paceibacterota bacterium]